MIFGEFSFLDAMILEVREDTSTRTLDLILGFPVDRDNVFESKVLRFKDVIVYVKKEIPFDGLPAILEIKQLHKHKHTYSVGNGTIESAKYKIEIVTNLGSRFLEFNEAELLDP
jgi:hypothetical protein